MNECPYAFCEYHHQYEPYCKLDQCVRTERQLTNYERLLELYKQKEMNNIVDTQA